MDAVLMYYSASLGPVPPPLLTKGEVIVRVMLFTSCGTGWIVDVPMGYTAESPTHGDAPVGSLVEESMG